MTRRIVPLALAMVVLYAALAIGAANCLILHADQPPAHHHSQSHLAHSAFCAWACQINPTVSFPAAVPLVSLSTVATGLRQIDSTVRVLVTTSESPSRAPPR